MFSRFNAKLESYFPNSTRGKNRYITYTVLGVVVGVSAYGIYKMVYSNANNDDDDDNDNNNNNNNNKPVAKVDLTNYHALVTNGTSDLGKQIIRTLMKRGCTVFMTYSDKKKMEITKQWIISTFDQNAREKLSLKLIPMPLDMSNLNNIQQFVSSFLSLNQSLHFLINNHDLMPSPKYEENNYRYEKVFAYNYLNTFYLTMLLTPKLIESSKATLGSRVINVSSSAFTMAPANFQEWIKYHHDKKQGPMENEYTMDGWTAYGISKAALIVWTREYNHRYENQGVHAFCVNPGILPLPLQKEEKPSSLLDRLKQLPLINKLFPVIKIAPQGSSTILKIICSDNNEIKGGTYWSDCNENEDILRSDLRSNDTKDDNKEILLWELSEELIRQTGLKMQ